MKAIDFLKTKGYKNITDIWAFEWKDKNRKYTNTPYAPHLEYVQCLYNSFPDDKKPEWISIEDINKYEEAMLAVQCK